MTILMKNFQSLSERHDLCRHRHDKAKRKERIKSRLDNAEITAFDTQKMVKNEYAGIVEFPGCNGVTDEGF
jgi:hypothetical protein